MKKSTRPGSKNTAKKTISNHEDSPEYDLGKSGGINLEVVERASSFSGPIPPPAILRDYDDTVPGAGDRIIQMAEKEQKWRHRAGICRFFNRGMKIVLSFLAVLAYISATVYVGLQDWRVGVALGISSGVAALVRGYFQKSKSKNS